MALVEEKTTLLLASARSHADNRRSSKGMGKRHWLQMTVCLTFVLLLFLSSSNWVSPGSWILPSCHTQPEEPPVEAHAQFDWLKADASAALSYHPCFGAFQCARLSVPINWNDTSNPARVAVAIIKVPAKVPVTDPRYGGVIVLNPGGPGNSGVYQILAGGKYIQTMVDAPQHPSLSAVSEGKYFDIISFDPRGVNNTTPHLKCFPNKQAELNWAAGEPSQWLYGTADHIVDLAWARSKAAGQSCIVKHGDEPNIAEFANTAQVVEDIVAIIEQHGEWRENEARKILSSPALARIPDMDRLQVLERTRWQKGAEKLLYWGFSYGTILGQTFATMHPDRVARVIIDGVVDPDDYYAADWLKNLQDTDKIIQRWAEYCQQAGEVCPFYIPGLPAAVVSSRIARGTWSLLDSPIPVAANEIHGPIVVTFNDVMEVLTVALYETRKMTETFVSLLTELNAGNGTRLARLKAAGESRPLELSEDCLRDGDFSEACVRDQGALMYKFAIACSDGIDLRNQTKDQFREYFPVLREQSDALGSFWSAIRMNCINWQARPAWRLDGPWTANTSHPLLLLSNTYDPVTPLRNAHHVSTLFPGSVVLQQNTEGHCTYSNPSLCTAKVVRAYFQQGTLPAPGTVCEPEYRPWIGCVNPAGCLDRTEEDQALWDAMDSLVDVWPRK